VKKNTALAVLAAFCVFAQFAPGVIYGEIITEMTEPHYNSLLAQAEMWRDVIAVEEKSFYPAFAAAGIQNGMYVVFFRFQPPGTEPVNFHGRHFSVMFDSGSNLVGMARIRPEWAGMNAASERRAADMALLFIRRFTPGLWRFRNSQLLEARSIEVKRESGENAVIETMMSFFYDDRRQSGFFVMVAPDGSVMAFERNVSPVAAKEGLVEENWLYDTYLERVLKAWDNLP